MKFFSTYNTLFSHKMSFLSTILLLNIVCCQASFAGQWDKSKPQSTDQKIVWPTASQANNDAIDRMLAGYREGMSLNYSSVTTISISAGEIMVSNAGGTVRLMLKNTSGTVTFADLDTGVEASATTYYIYAVATSTSDETATFKISASSTAPSGITYYKRLGSFYNNSSSDITTIVNDNDLSAPGTLTSKSEGVVYQASTNGLVMGMSNYDGVTEGNYFQGYVGQTSSSLTQIVGTGDDNSGASYGTTEGATFYVKKGEYWKVLAKSGATITINFLPLGN